MTNEGPGIVKKKNAPNKTTEIYKKIDLKQRFLNFPLNLFEMISRSFAPCNIPIDRTPKLHKKSIKLADNKGTKTRNNMVTEIPIW